MIEFSNSHSNHRLRARALRGHFVLGVALVIATLSAMPSSAQTIEMTKIVVRNTSPIIAPDSLIGAKPTTIYRAGDKYLRIEEQANPAEKHTLIITREPESWMINLADHTAKHLLDPGPTFDARLYIFWLPKPPSEPDPDKVFQGLEFGNEASFFRQNSPRDLGLRKIDGKDVKAFAIKSGAHEVTLFLDPATEKPVQIDVTKNGKPDLSYRYLAYEDDLKFDPALFEPPEGLQVTEAK